MKTTSELAREAAQWSMKNGLGFVAQDTLEWHIQSALDAQAAQYREALKVATDALEKVKKWGAKQQVADLQAELRASNRNWERACDEAKQAVYQPPTTERDTLRAEVARLTKERDVMRNAVIAFRVAPNSVTAREAVDKALHICPKPGCGAQNRRDEPCSDFDCPQRV